MRRDFPLLPPPPSSPFLSQVCLTPPFFRVSPEARGRRGGWEIGRSFPKAAQKLSRACLVRHTVRVLGNLLGCLVGDLINSSTVFCGSDETYPVMAKTRCNCQVGRAGLLRFHFVLCLPGVTHPDCLPSDLLLPRWLTKSQHLNRIAPTSLAEIIFSSKKFTTLWQWICV